MAEKSEEKGFSTGEVVVACVVSALVGAAAMYAVSVMMEDAPPAGTSAQKQLSTQGGK